MRPHQITGKLMAIGMFDEDLGDFVGKGRDGILWPSLVPLIGLWCGRILLCECCSMNRGEEDDYSKTDQPHGFTPDRIRWFR